MKTKKTKDSVQVLANVLDEKEKVDDQEQRKVEFYNRVRGIRA